MRCADVQVFMIALTPYVPNTLSILQDKALNGLHAMTRNGTQRLLVFCVCLLGKMFQFRRDNKLLSTYDISNAEKNACVEIDEYGMF